MRLCSSDLTSSSYLGYFQPADVKFCHFKIHSRPQRPRSFWSAPGIETSGRLQNRKSAIHGLIVKYDKSDWLKNTERVLCACSEIGSGQRSRFLAQTRRIAASGDENVQDIKIQMFQCDLDLQTLPVCNTRACTILWLIMFKYQPR